MGQSSLLKRKRGWENYGFASLGRRLLRRDTPPPIGEGVQQVDVSASAGAPQADATYSASYRSNWPRRNCTHWPRRNCTHWSRCNCTHWPKPGCPPPPTSQASTASALPGFGASAASALPDSGASAASAPGQGVDTSSTDPKSSSSPGADKTDGGSPTSSGLGTGLVRFSFKVTEEQKSTGKSWKIKITDDSKPLWFMCNPPHHCTSGMVFAVNPSDSGRRPSRSASRRLKAAPVPTPYPTKTNLQGDGCSADAAPLRWQEERQPSSRRWYSTSNIWRTSQVAQVAHARAEHYGTTHCIFWRGKRCPTR
ncbi:hypothetical protein Pst134EB_018094 [Puccinia striiformis f. sp. tritici]|nr:hypothetical protein Pst134EB_018094 [Puccinia striiformis f. sp. tritici]